MTLNKTQSAFLTDAQINFYNDEGYLLLPDFLTDEEMRPARQAMEEKTAEIADELYAIGATSQKFEDYPFESRLARLFDSLQDSDFLKFGRSWRERRPGYFQLMATPKILDVVESLIGGEIFSNPVYNVRPKVPRVAAGAVPWHQDKSYWPDANSNPVITVWIPLVDATLENGCLHIWPRTHKKRVLSHHADTYTGTAYTELDVEHLIGAKGVALPVKAGSAILFNDRCIHMSTPNNSQNVRWSVDLRYQPTDQDPMPQHGTGFLARSYQYPERVATLEDWLTEHPEHLSNVADA
ncbi:MAG: phytanoyl-CoA dioxygenase family protein [Anaerolineae bacterium]|nr:phytanoyl-CoA dioxygenase family protein [Anaerolineae bacterium]